LDVDVTGKSFMITGANSGIGKCAAVAVAQQTINIFFAFHLLHINLK
jgi:NADP-dependent 3-hydroxy acid dehydrogenase YdfG